MAKKVPEKITKITKNIKNELTPISWDAFRKTGLLAFVNGFLNIFGVAIALDRNTGIAFPFFIEITVLNGLVPVLDRKTCKKTVKI